MIKLKLGHKIGAGYVLMALLLVAAGVAEFYGLGRLSQSLDCLVGPAWHTADGSMETRIRVHNQMIAADHITQGIDPDSSREILSLVQAIQAVAEGDLTTTFQLRANLVNIRSRDEVGQMALAFNTMNEALAGVGDNFARMLINLRHLIGQTQLSAGQVANASQQLSAAAEQAGGAGQQVAQRTNQQTQAITKATANVEQIAHAADGIAKGTQEQARGVQKTSDLIEETGSGYIVTDGQAERVPTPANRRRGNRLCYRCNEQVRLPIPLHQLMVHHHPHFGAIIAGFWVS